jgi:RNA polymerase-binding protein DksA
VQGVGQLVEELDVERIDSQLCAELLDLRSRVLGAAQDLVSDDDDASELSSAAGDQHLADHASDMFDREVDESLEENAEQLVQDIDAALARIDQGTYGVCARCGNPIPVERLDAVPYATLCVDCKRREERE